MAPILPLAEVFTTRENLFSRPMEEVRREVARQITIAGEHVPILKKLLSHKGEKQAELSSSAIAQILTSGQQVCSLLGINFLVPKALKEMVRPTVSLVAQTKKRSGKKITYLNLEEILDFSWQISLGNTTITREEFMQLTQSAEGVVKFRDQYLLLEPQTVKKILDKLETPLPRLSSPEMLQAAITGEIEGITFRPDEMLCKLIKDFTGRKKCQRRHA